jgi:hypothetical protein
MAKQPYAFDSSKDRKAHPGSEAWGHSYRVAFVESGSKEGIDLGEGFGADLLFMVGEGQA